MGERAQFVDQGGLLTLTLDSVDPSPITQIFLTSPGEGPSGPHQLGGNDGSALVNFLAIVLSPPFQYQTGDGSEEKNIDDVVVFTQPGPSNFSITKYSDGKMKGNASGQLFALTNFDTLNPVFESASWSVEFSAESGLNPDGSADFDACTGN